MAPEGCRRAKATSSFTTLRLKPANRSRRTSGTTARSIRGNSSASGISSRRCTIPTRLRGRGRRGDFPIHRRRQNRGRNWPDCAAHDTGPKWQPGAGGMCLHTILLDPNESEANLHRHLGRGRVSHRRRRKNVEADQSAGCTRNTFRIRTRKSAIACIASRCIRRGPNTLFMQKHWDVMRSDDAGGSVAVKSAAICRAISDFRSTCMRTSRKRFTSCRSRAIRSIIRPNGKVARLSQPHRRQRMGSADERSAARELLRERAARRDVRRFARSVRHLFRHHRRPGLWLARTAATTGSRSCAICRPCCRWKCRHCHDPRCSSAVICERWRTWRAK